MSVYEGHGVTLHHGDCLDVLRTLPDASVDSVVTDPPYNLSFMAKPWDAYEGREDAGFAYWLSGLIDGEGHFAIKAHSRGTHAPYFQLKMRADERGTLDRIRRLLGVGVVSIESKEPNPMAKYVIQDKAGCQRLVDLLDKYPLRAKKQLDYWTWREAVCEWTSRPRGNRWHGAVDNAHMAELRSRLMENRAYTDVPWSGHEFQDWCRLWATECLRVLKPGGHLLAFGGTRTWHRLACAVEDAGFEVRDSIAWLYGCLSDDTEILTSEGWVRYDRAKEGQHALAFDTATGALAWQAIQHVHRYPYAGEMVRLHSEHTDQLLTPNHRVVLDAESRLPYASDVCDLRDAMVEAERMGQADRGALLLSAVQRSAARPGVGEARAQGSGGVDRREPGVLPREDDRAEEPRMEGRRYRVQEARELCRGALRASAGMGATDGTQGRVHHGAPATDGRPLRVPAYPAGSHQPREPRPQGQPTGEPDPLAHEPGAQALRVGEDGGGRLLPSTGVTADVVDYAGVVWCITVPHGAFIARRNGLIFATGNSGFPKSLDVSKAIDKGGHLRDARGREFQAWLRQYLTPQQVNAATDTNMGHHLTTHPTQPAVATADLFDLLRPLLPDVPERIERLVAERTGLTWEDYQRRAITGKHLASVVTGDAGMTVRGEGKDRRDIPNTDEAAQWAGWGTALKPAFEPVVVARKPLSGTVAANVLAHGTGALNIDGCRVTGATGLQRPERRGKGETGGWANYEQAPGQYGTPDGLGRWPANVVLDGPQAEALDEQSGERPGFATQNFDGTTAGKAEGWGNIGAIGGERREGFNDTGGASRFFYVAKADATERPRVNGTAHPTVKPLSLMRWLVRLVTPPCGTVLEPFAGSGTTVEACIVEGFQCIAIEKGEEYLPLIMQRIHRRREPVAAIRQTGD